MRIYLVAFFCLLLSCDQIDKLTQFKIRHSSETTISSGVSVGLPWDVATPPVQTNSTEEYESNDTRKDLVEKISLVSSTLTVISPEGDDFSFLKEISIYINAAGLEEELIAFHSDVPPNAGNVLILTCTESDLKPYIDKDTYSLRVSVVTDELVTEDIGISIDNEFFVDARILGL